MSNVKNTVGSTQGFKVQDHRKKKPTQKEMSEALKKAQEPKYIKELELGAGEVYVGNLSDADKTQLLNRRLQLLESHANNQTLLLAQIAVCLQEQCKSQGIDIEKIINRKE